MFFNRADILDTCKEDFMKLLRDVALDIKKEADMAIGLVKIPNQQLKELPQRLRNALADLENLARSGDQKANALAARIPVFSNHMNPVYIRYVIREVSDAASEYLDTHPIKKKEGWREKLTVHFFATSFVLVLGCENLAARFRKKRA
ncbi:MAG: hypothetical protein Q8Q13_02655 [bacterium]|nr:hypothetical protein [bacterium]